ncbi:MAG: ABC transporter permease [Nisaea sp.]|uniref:ABC transporter permease n=1 Tax=Nisaea sp. TaxID=2024842 RepID=UPI001B099C68|nr:ABC transporter permease [Nisaea sp.]MBO6562572.1 ABC transporter permease [Nisaea sp.]
MGGAISAPGRPAKTVSFAGALFAMAGSLRSNGFILKSMVRSELASRYRNTVLGFLWPLINPLVMILVYSFVFGLIFKVRFGATPSQSEVPYGIVLFSGLMLHVLLAETLLRAQSIVLENPNYVKRVVFPLEILPVAALLSNLVHAFMALAVLVAVILGYGVPLHWTGLLLPLVWLPFVVMLAGLGLLVASLGVFIRDIGQVLGFMMTILMFGSSILFPPEMLPEPLRPWLLLNPLTIPVDASRDVLLWGHFPNWERLGLYSVVAVAALWIGSWWFLRTKRGFSEVM